MHRGRQTSATRLISSPDWLQSYCRAKRERSSSSSSISLGSAVPWKNPGLSSRAQLIEVNQKQCFHMSQLLPGWTALCSPQTRLKSLINHRDTQTWDISSRSALAVNDSARQGSVCEAESLNWLQPDPIMLLQKTEIDQSRAILCSRSLWWTQASLHKWSLEMWIEKPTFK